MSFPFHHIGWNTMICEPIFIGKNTQGPQSTNAFWLEPRKYTQSLVDFLLKIQNCKTTTILMFWQADEIVCLLSALSDSQVPRLASNGLESALERDAFSPKPSCSDNKPRRRTKCKILKINYAEELMTTFTWFSTSHCSGSQIVIDEPIIHWLNRLNRIKDGSVV